MRTLATMTLTIGFQLTLGLLICAAGVAFLPGGLRGLDRTRRRRVVVRARAAARMMRALPLAVTLGLAGAALMVALGVGPENLLTGAAGSAYLILGLISTCAGYLLHDAARQESAGRLRIARRQTRFAGPVMFWGTLVLLAWIGVDVLLRPGLRSSLFDGPPPAIAVMGVGLIALGASACTALLAGLSRKPRPSGTYAVLLYLCGLCGVLSVVGSV